MGVFSWCAPKLSLSSKRYLTTCIIKDKNREEYVPRRVQSMDLSTRERVLTKERERA